MWLHAKRMLSQASELIPFIYFNTGLRYIVPVNVWCPMTNCHRIQVVFSPRDKRSRGRRQIHPDPDQDKALTESEYKRVNDTLSRGHDTTLLKVLARTQKGIPVRLTTPLLTS